MTAFAQRLKHLHERIDAATKPGQRVTLIAVSKRHPSAAITQALAAGQLDFGENYAQELTRKQEELTSPEQPIRWHFIGPIQSNKAKLVVGCTLLHTLDRAKLLAAVEQRAHTLGCVQDVLVQVNIAAEAHKSGIAVSQLPELLDRIADTDHVRARGLMLIPPVGTPEATRKHFCDLALLRDAMMKTSRRSVELAELSMGMSADFELAIEQGATMIRVGTALFGPRPDTRPS